eukprot:5824413-Prymnesium_polylepis.1
MLSLLLAAQGFLVSAPPQCPAMPARRSPLWTASAAGNSSSAPGSSSSDQGASEEQGGRESTQRSGANAGRWALAALAAGGAAVATRGKRQLPVVMIHGILDNAENMEESAAW